MTTASCKAKGRRLQQEVSAALLEVGEQHGLVKDDIKSTSMGVSGVDVLLSPAAKKVLGCLAIECKNVEALGVVTTFNKHAEKYPKHTALLVHKKNRSQTLVTMKFDDFLRLLKDSVLLSKRMGL